MPASRRFLFPDSQAGVFHVCSRLVGLAYYLEEGDGREEFVKMMRAYEDFCGVEVLTYCVMSNHFHLLVRVPHRPAGFEVSMKVLVARLDRALGETAAAELHKQLVFWETTKNVEAIEDWRHRQVARMFSLSENAFCQLNCRRSWTQFSVLPKNSPQWFKKPESPPLLSR